MAPADRPSGSYFIAIGYRIRESDKFDGFVKEFGEGMVEKIIRAVDSVELDEKIESRLDDIDSGKERLARYPGAREYLKHVDELIEE